MKFTETKSGKMSTILAADHFIAIPIKITESTVCKAGAPIKTGGKLAIQSGDGGVVSAKISDAIGVLLYDVDPAVNPNGALLIHGVVDSVKAKASSGLDLAGITAVVPGITLRSDLGTNT